MADFTSLATDPFFSLSQQVGDVKSKVADSIFENYKLQVAQANDINNRAMQVALHDSTALADLKTQVDDGTLCWLLLALTLRLVLQQWLHNVPLWNKAN
jgi:hypothetical protein